MEVFESISPSMNDRVPPVTRLMTFSIEAGFGAGPVKVAFWPVCKLNWPKLWKRLFPLVAPASAGMTKFGPVSGPLGAPGLIVPSRVIWAVLTPGCSRNPVNARRLPSTSRIFVTITGGSIGHSNGSRS